MLTAIIFSSVLPASMMHDTCAAYASWSRLAAYRRDVEEPVDVTYGTIDAARLPEPNRTRARKAADLAYRHYSTLTAAEVGTAVRALCDELDGQLELLGRC